VSETYCHIKDTHQCKYDDDIGFIPGLKWPRLGKAFAWDPVDYHNFAKAFFRNEKLVDAFIKPEFKGIPHL